MASNFISIGSSPHGRGFLRLMDRLNGVLNDLADSKANFDQIAAGSDFEALAEKLGMDSATDAEAVYNLVGSLNDALNSGNAASFFAQLRSRTKAE